MELYVQLWNCGAESKILYLCCELVQLKVLFDAFAGDRSHYISCFMLVLWIGPTTDPM